MASPRNPVLPPLTALRAFEAAARHGSFKGAAAELHVTPAAVSHQINALEEHLGVTLFRRLTRKVRLTAAGEAGLADLSAAFALLAQGVDKMRAEETGGALTVGTTPSFAAKWLILRLENFRRTHPGLDVRIDARIDLVDFARDDVDLAIRYGRGVYPGLHVDTLARVVAIPVCSPALLQGPDPLREPADLRHHTLLHEDWEPYGGGWVDWEMWLRSAGVTGVDPTKGPRYNHTELVIEAAIDGQGVALVNTVLAQKDLESGRLVRAFDLGIQSDFGYFLVCPPAALAKPKVAAFRDWMLAESRSVAEAAAAAANPGTADGTT